MAWSWSHTSEAYAAAYDNLHEQEREWLCVTFAEWRACETDDDGNLDANSFNEADYDDALALCVDLPSDVIADDIWERMSEQATCDNGGWNAWACPSGCHTVPFSPVSRVCED